jgi:CheY-like chemotaxis protein
MRQIDVLIIEDSFFSADLNVRELRKAGFSVEYQVVASGRAMQKALRDRQWDVILSDNRMPGFDALQALEIKKQEDCQTPFMIVSEDMPDKDIKRAMDGGCCAYISKEYLGGLGKHINEALEASSS